MATTTNFGWETPDDTDLVKDGAAAMRTLGNSIDTSFVDLKGGTTGQILSKASNTDLDYTWITNDIGDITEVAAGTGISGGGTSGAVTITNSMATAIDAKGDLIAGTGADTFSRLAVGTNGQALLADSTTATGLKWGSASATPSFSLLGTGTTTSGSTVTVSSLSGYNTMLILFRNISTSSNGSDISIRFNSDTGNNYDWAGAEISLEPTYTSSSGMYTVNSGATNSIFLTSMPSGVATGQIAGAMVIYGANSTGIKAGTMFATGDKPASYTSQRRRDHGFVYSGTSVISSISIITGSGTFDAGSFSVYGSVA